jgi:hypothetical protein
VERVPDKENAFGAGHAQLAADDVAREDVAVAIEFHANAPRFGVAAQVGTLSVSQMVNKQWKRLE